MRRILAVVSAVSLLVAAFPAAAQTTPAYPTLVTNVSNQVLQSANALGAPDDQYATYMSKNATMTLDFGQDVSGDLTVVYQLLQFGAQYQVDFLDANGGTLAMGGGTFNLGTVATVAYKGTGSYRAVRVTDADGQTWKLDAVSATAVNPPPAPAPAPTPISTPAPAPLVQGSLVKRADVSSVYEIGADGKRHAFPAESVFFSWYPDFSSVQTISPALLATYALGKNVTMRPGTKLVKITTDPQVYAVYADATLRWVPSESVAQILFGLEWNKKVVDVADVFFSNYKKGLPLTSNDLPPVPDAAVPYPY